MTRAVRNVNPLSPGSGVRLRELYALPRWSVVILLLISSAIKHYVLTAAFLLIGLLWWYDFGPLWMLVIAVIVAWLFVLGCLILLSGGNWKTPYYYLNLRWRYRRAITAVGLKSREDRGIPRLYHIRPAKHGLKFRIRLRDIGKGVVDLAAEEDEFAEAIGAERGSVSKHKPGIANVTLTWDAEFDEVIEDDSPGVSSETKDGADDTRHNSERCRVQIGQLSGGGPATVSLALSLLIVGIGRSGKSNIMRACLHALNRQAIPHSLYVCDPKGGVELPDTEHLSNTIAYTKSPAGCEAVIRKAWEDMNERFTIMRQMGIKEVTIGDEFDLRIILVDELLRLPKQLMEDDGPAWDILTNGSAAGYVIIGLSQLGQVDAIGRIRDLFPQRICLRTSSPDMTDSVLGRRAEANGAVCSRIPISARGVGYIFDEREVGLRRFRATRSGGALANIDGPTVVDGGTSNRRCSVYRYYNVMNRCLRIGHAYDPEQRAKQYATSVLWWTQVDHNLTKIDWYRNKEAAVEAETEAIRREDPIHNRQHRRRADANV